MNDTTMYNMCALGRLAVKKILIRSLGTDFGDANLMQDKKTTAAVGYGGRILISLCNPFCAANNKELCKQTDIKIMRDL